MTALRQPAGFRAMKPNAAVARNKIGAHRASKHDTTALALFGAMFIVLAIVGGASLSAVGSGALQETVNVTGFGRVSHIEGEQRRQAAVLAALEPTIQSVSHDVGALGRKIKLVDQDNVAVNDRFSLVDADIAAVVAELKSLRATRETSARESRYEPVGRLDTVVSAAGSDVLALRSSFDEHQQTYRRDIGAINKRLDRLERASARDLTASINPVARKKVVRRKPRPKPAPTSMTLWGEAPHGIFRPGSP
jgi:hypothetical protein